MASEDEKCKTLADLVAEYRNDADAMDRGWLYQPTTEYLRRLLDRIEAIDSADAWRSLYSPGNAAAMREALENIAGYAQTAKCHTEDGHILGYLDQIEKWAKSALSAPARNCDVGTAEVQGERCMAQFNEWRRKSDGKKLITAIMEWAQMPYEAEEGGAK